MTSGLGKTLPIQARDLLDQRSELLQRPGGGEQIRSKALECHAKMLELGELQRSEAIEHALAGAELLAALHGHPSSEPDWVAVHEEQCCRHGALWVQAAFNESETAQTIAWGHQALVLLDRLGQLLSPQPTWAKLLHLDLRDRLKQLSPELLPGEQNSPSIVLVGNCQAFPLLLGLRNGLPEASINYCNSVHLATAAEVARLHQALPKADVLVMHRVQPGYRNNIGLDSTTLKSLLSPSARCLVLPNLHYEGQLPWCGYGQDPDGRLAALEADSPLGPYQDFLAMAAAGLGLDAEDLLNQSCPEGVAALLQIAHQSSLAELQSREAQCNVQLSDWIAEHHRHQPIGHTINHPTQASLRELLRRLIGQLDPENRLGPDPFDGQDHLDSLSLPIHPWVQQALNLGAWSTSWGQRENIPFSIQAQLSESIAFYRLHPWIAAANADHPKLTFAKHCLGFLPKVSNETGSRQADHANKAASDSTTTYSVVIQFFEDFDFIEPVVRQLTWVDEIIVNDGPFTFAVELMTSVVGRDVNLSSERTQEICLRLSLELGIPIHYHYNTFEDERAKRVYGYDQAKGLVVMSVDADEFLMIKPEQVEAFARSEALAASFNCYNFTFLNLLLSGPTGTSISSPKPFAFKRAAISAEEHIKYLWLVGVDQATAPAQHFLPGTLCDGIHLTTVRSDYGASIKFGFYTCLYFKRTGLAIEGAYADLLNFFQGSSYPIELRTEVMARALPDAAGFPTGHVLQRPQKVGVPAVLIEKEMQLSRDLNRNKLKRQIAGNLLPSIPMHIVSATGRRLRVTFSVAGSARLKVTPLRLGVPTPEPENEQGTHVWIAEALQPQDFTMAITTEAEENGALVGFLLELTLWTSPELKEQLGLASIAPTFNLSVHNLRLD